MGRPTASKENKEFALAFAQLTTCQSGSPDHIVARCGECSIFALLRTIFPTMVRNEEAIPRDGISEVEFNKVLQASGFVKARNRRIGASNRMNDPSGAGLYVFSNRRWMNPDDRQEIALLVTGISSLAERFPRFQLEQVALLESLRRTLSIWDSCLFIYNPRKKRRGISAAPSALSGDFKDKKASPPNMTLLAELPACNSIMLLGPAAAIHDAAWETIVNGSSHDGSFVDYCSTAEFAQADPLFTNPFGELVDDIGC